MKNRTLLGIVLTFCVHLCWAQGTAFTYQGRLNSFGQPATGYFDLTYSLFDASSGGNQVGSTITNLATPISNGLFTATIDFGPGIFVGPSRWLEVGVRTNGSSSFVTLTPRQAVTPSPYAITAENLNGTLSNSGLSGTYGNAITLNNSANQFAGTYSGNGAGITNVDAGTVGGLGPGRFWQTSGNGGTTAGINFLGTTDPQPLELKVNGQRALRFEPTTSSPNVIGGFGGNYVSNAVGVTIGGGGANATPNVVYRPPFTLHNSPADFATIAGGVSNMVFAGLSTTISGGASNLINFTGVYFGAPDYSVISGGSGNAITSVPWSFIGGGNGNAISPSENSEACDTIAGGQGNQIVYGGWSTIGGGFQNQNFGNYSAIGGGAHNYIFGVDSTPGPAWYSVIGGGSANFINGGCIAVTIPGGSGNSFGFMATYSTIGGGQSNVVGSYCDNGVIAGGMSNTITSYTTLATISGGQGNRVNGSWGTIPGGANNVATNYAFAAGRQAQANHQGAFVWADSQNATFGSSATDQVSFRCQGGVRFTSGSGAANQTVSWTPGSGSWAFSSDRNLKDRFAPVDVRSVLDKVDQLPLSEWSYKGYNQRHIGVMAQDFHSLFALNDDDKVLNDADLHGVTLAAIQGLNQKLEERLKAKDAEIEQLQQKVREISETLNRLTPSHN